MTTATPPEYETAKDLDEATKAALHRLLRAIADTKLLLGYHYGEWTFGTPVLEAAVANCSLAQSELGHLRLLDGILKKFFGDDPDALLADRDPEAFANVRYLDHDLPGWAECVAMNAVVDFAITTLLNTMHDSSFRPVRQSVDKMLDEERYHVHHGRGWLRTWAARGDEERAALSAQAGAALAHVAEWFGPAGEADDEALVAAGIKTSTNTDILEVVRAEIDRLASDVGLSLPETEAADFGSWTPESRRSGPGGPEAEILSHLRGDRNDLFKLS
jgi:ring-1,2-phenylacetyl-CoA epoxidase subunit PaaC